MRILVDGLEMTGKSTLTRAIITVLAKHGVSAVRHKGMVTSWHPAKPLLKKLPLVRQPRSALITTIFLVAGYGLDAVLLRLFPPRSDATVIVQDSYVDRCVAFGIAGGPYRSALWALRYRSWFTPFDVAVYLHAPTDTRADRLTRRTSADENDHRSVTDIEFADTFTNVLIHGMGPRHRRLLVFNTAMAAPHEMAEQVAEILLSLRLTPPAPAPRTPAMKQQLPHDHF